jgi:hypothetical protein
MKREKIMYAVFRKKNDNFPEVILNRAREAKEQVGINKSYWWGKTSYYQRVVVKIDPTKEIVDVVKHTRITK